MDLHRLFHLEALQAILSIFDLISLVFMALFCVTIKRNSVCSLTLTLTLPTRRPNLVLINKGKKPCHLVNFAVQENHNENKRKRKNRKMYQADNKKQKTRNDGRNKSTKSRKNQNARREGNLQILGNIRRRHPQTSRNERKEKKKKDLRRMRKLLETKLYAEMSSKR